MKQFQRKLSIALVLIMTISLFSGITASANEGSYVVSMSASGEHAVFLMSDGSVKAVGRNDFGQLGDGTTTNRRTPIAVPGLTDVKEVGVGTGYTIYLMNDGTVKAVGKNNSGQLGDGTWVDKPNIFSVPDLIDVKSISVGDAYTLFLMNDGTVKASGNNSGAQLGDGTATNRYTPITIPGIEDVKAVSAGGASHTVFLMNDGTVKAVGRNTYGQLGDGTTVFRYTPVSSNISGVKAVSAGGGHTLFLMNDNTVKGVGRNNYSQLVDASISNKLNPINLIGLSEVKKVSAGLYHSVFLMNSGGVKAIGYNTYGQLGDGTLTTRREIVDVLGLTGVQDVVTTYQNTYYLMDDGTVKSTGDNTYGQLGDGTFEQRMSPVDVLGFIAISTPPVAPTITPGSTAPTNGPVTVTAQFSADSVLNEYSLNGTDWSTYADGVVLTSNGTVYFRSQNASGSYSEITTYTVSNIDTTSPIAPVITPSSTEPTNGPVTVTAQFGADATLNVYSLDGTQWLVYDSGVIFTSNGTVQFRSKDEAGNWSETVSYTVSNITTGGSPVEEALNNPTQENLDGAWNVVHDMEPSVEKDDLFDQLLNVDTVFKEAHDAVEKALTNDSRTNIIDAVNKVQDLSPDNPYRNDYKTIVNELVTEYNSSTSGDDYSTRALYFTKRAEDFPTLYYVNKAMSYILLMGDGETKTGLTERVNTVADALVGGSSFYDVSMATKYVDLAEQHESVSLINKAQSLVSRLKDSPIKTTLQNRINSI